ATRGIAAALSVSIAFAPVLSAKDNDRKPKDAASAFATDTPIKHVIILIGENRGLDHTFGVYRPKGKKQTISNILSKGIVNEDGAPGPNFGQAQQFSVAAQPTFYVGAPNQDKAPYNTTSNLMPQPNTNGAPTAQSTTSPPFITAPPDPDIEQQNAFLLTT